MSLPPAVERLMGRGAKWTPEQIEAMRNRYQAEGAKALALEFGRTERAVVSHAQRIAVAKERLDPQKLTHKQNAVLRIYWMREPTYVTAKRINRNLHVAEALAIGLGLPPDTWVRQRDNERNGGANYAPATLAKPRKLTVTRETLAWAIEAGMGNPEARMIATALVKGQAVVA